MRVLIAGGSGFIGQHLTKYLRAQGHVVVILGRDKQTNRLLQLNRSFPYVHYDHPQQ